MLVDGAENKEDHDGGTTMVYSLEGVEEFKALKSSFSAEYGKAATVVVLALKSGTNVFRGSLFGYGRNESLTATDYFSKPENGGFGKQPFKRMQFGGLAGGPILKDRIWFFGSVERVHQDFTLPRPDTLFQQLRILERLDIGAVASRSIAQPFRDAVGPGQGQRPAGPQAQRVRPIRHTFPSVSTGASHGFPHWHNWEDKVELRNDFSMQRGRHGFKFGADYMPIPLYGGIFGGGSPGNITFFDDPSVIVNNTNGRYPQGFQTPGIVRSITVVSGTIGDYESESAWNFGAYAQDDFKVSSRVTLNLGVRYDVYEYMNQPSLDKNRTFHVLEAIGSPYGKLPRTDTNDVSPRLGVAWDLRGDGRDVVRAGYGMFYGQGIMNSYFQQNFAARNIVYFPQTYTNSAIGSGALASYVYGVTPIPTAQFAPSQYPGGQNVQGYCYHPDLKRRFSATTALQADYALAWANGYGGSSDGTTEGGYLPPQIPSATGGDLYAPWEWGPTAYDERHRITVAGVFSLPFKIDVSPSFTAASARPYTQYRATNPSGDGSLQILGADGNPVGINRARGKPLVNANARLTRNFTLPGSGRLALFAEFYNLVNRANFGNNYGGNAFAPSTYTQPTGYLGGFASTSTIPISFQVQFGARLSS